MGENEPTTEAGRALLGWMIAAMTDGREEAYRARILAIEAEARDTADAEIQRLREALQQDAPLLHAYVHPDIAFNECDSVRCSKRRALLADKPVGSGEQKADVRDVGLWPSEPEAERHG